MHTTSETKTFRTRHLQSADIFFQNSNFPVDCDAMMHDRKQRLSNNNITLKGTHFSNLDKKTYVTSFRS